jgi:putative Mn2+ efflux pump MntP
LENCSEALIFNLNSKRSDVTVEISVILLIAVGLAMDAFAVSIAKGMATTKDRKKTALLLASFFGGFQMMMPVFGWLAGLSFRDVISSIDHWIAFGLLTFIGLKMMYDSTTKEHKEKNSLKIHSVLTLSIATSIDALMVGLSFALLQTEIFFPVLTIGIVTFTLSLAGFIFGCGLGKIFESRVRIIGGIILIILGIQILIEHTI